MSEELVRDDVRMTRTFVYRVAGKDWTDHPEFRMIRPDFLTVVLDRRGEREAWEIADLTIKGAWIRASDGQPGKREDVHVYTTHAGRFVDPNLPPWADVLAHECLTFAEMDRHGSA